MSKYFNNSENDFEENSNKKTDDFNEEEYEQYIPYFDEDEGEYKYTPAGDNQNQGNNDDQDINDEYENDYQNSNYQNEDDYNKDYYIKKREHNQGIEKDCIQNKNSDNDFTVNKIMDKIDVLNTEIKNSNKKTEEDKINKLNEEINILKEQLFRTKTVNDLKSQFEEFKRDFIKSQKENKYTKEYKPENDYKFYGYDSDYDDYFKRKNKDIKKESYYNDRNYDVDDKNEHLKGIEINKIVEKVKKDIYQEKEFDNNKILKEIEKLNEKNFTEQDIINKVNSVVEEKVENSLKNITAIINTNMQKILNEYNNKNIAVLDDILSKNDNEETLTKIDEIKGKFKELEENTLSVLTEYNDKQNDILMKFNEIVEKIESKNVIDKDDLYAETMLDGITDIKTDLRNAVNNNEQLNEDNKNIKEDILSLSEELHSFKENLGQTVTDSVDYQLKLINTNIENVSEKFDNLTENYHNVIDEIKQQLAFELEKNTNKEDINVLQDKLSQKIDDIVLKLGLFEQSEEDAEILSFKDIIKKEIEKIKEQTENNVKNAIDKSLEENTFINEKIEKILLLTEEMQNSKEELSDIINENTEKILQTTQETNSVKEDLTEIISNFKEKIDNDLQVINSELSKNLQLQQEQMLTIIQNELNNPNNNSNDEIKDILEKQEEIIKDFINTSAENINAIEGLNISIDTLLRQAEENVSAQSNISINMESVNAQLSAINEKLQEVKEKYQETGTEIKETEKSEDKNIKDIENKLDKLKQLILTKQNTDIKYDLSSIFTELRKINEKNKDDKLQDNYIKLSSDLDNLRKKLDKISQIDISKNKTQ